MSHCNDNQKSAVDQALDRSQTRPIAPELSPFGWYKQAFDKFVSAKGRLPLRGFWYYVLFNISFALLALALDVVLHFTIKIDFLFTTYVMIFILPSLAATSRRLHDVGRSGWAQILLFIPVIGWFFLIKWLMQPGIPEDNKYGPYIL